ncbi:MAG: metal-dependent hydrolase [Bacteroidota bacterium]
MKVTFYGHACFGIEVAGKHLLFDPFISPNELAANVKIEEIPADYILISHAHFDHVADVEAIAKRTEATLISNYEIITYFGKKGLKGHPMNHGGSWKFDFGTVQYVNAVHTSSFEDGSYGGNPGGFVVSAEEGSFYFSGDTALTYDMKLISEDYSLKFAILCMGDNFTMGVKDAIKAANFVACDQIIGMHFDTFGYIKIDHEAAVKQFGTAGKNLNLLEIGQAIEI